MRVFLTIDVETYTGFYDRDIWGQGLGLRFIVESLCRYGLRATFFIEALGIQRWGHEPTQAVCRYLVEHGQIIQLHIHPSLAGAEWHTAHCGDRLWACDLKTQTGLIREGKRLLEECGVPPVSVFRAGDLAANEDTLRAMNAAGIVIGSNRDFDCKGSIHSQVTNIYPCANDVSKALGVIDVPLSCFRSPIPLVDGQFRHLQVTAVGLDEMKSVLNTMRQLGYCSATILTHPGEFFFSKKNTLWPNQTNRQRWVGLLDYLVAERFDVGVMDATLLTLESPDVFRVIPRGSEWLALRRLLEQAKNHRNLRWLYTTDCVSAES